MRISEISKMPIETGKYSRRDNQVLENEEDTSIVISKSKKDEESFHAPAYRVFVTAQGRDLALLNKTINQKDRGNAEQNHMAGRSVEQMDELDSVLKAQNEITLRAVIEVEVSENTARERVLGRARGADDNVEVFNNRMRVFSEPLEQIHKFYGERNLLQKIDGERTIEVIVADMKNLIENLIKG